MNEPTLFCLVASLCLSLTAPAAFARYDEHDAERDCKRRISRDVRYKGTRDVRVE